MKKAMIEIGVMMLIVSVLAVVLVTSIIVGTGKSELSECTKWSQEASVYPGFYLAQWQKNQCDAHGVVINAEVK